MKFITCMMRGCFNKATHVTSGFAEMYFCEHCVRVHHIKAERLA